MALPDPKYQQTFDPVLGHARRFTDLVRSLTPAEAQMHVPGMGWQAADVAAHVETVMRRYYANPDRAATPADLRSQNDAEIDGVGFGLDVSAAADAIDGHTEALAAVAPALPLDATFPFHLGLTVTTCAGWANLLSEFLVHGDDISRATGRPWTFPAADVEGIWRNLVPVATGWLRPEARNVDELYRVRFAFGDVDVWIHDGVVTVDDADRPPDHQIDVEDPVEFTLGVPWRRHLITDAAAALMVSRFFDI
jgi:hypothetical protein